MNVPSLKNLASILLLALVFAGCQKSTSTLSPMSSTQVAAREGGGPNIIIEEDLNIFQEANPSSDNILTSDEIANVGDCKQLSFEPTAEAHYYVIAYRPVGELGDNTSSCIDITPFEGEDRWFYQTLSIGDVIPATIEHTLNTLCPNTEYEVRVLSWENAPSSPLHSNHVIEHSVSVSDCE